MSNFIDQLLEHANCDRCDGSGWFERWEEGRIFPNYNDTDPTHDEPCPDCLQTGISDFAILILELKVEIAKALMKAKGPVVSDTPLVWDENEDGKIASLSTKDMYIIEAETLLGLHE